MLLKLYLCVVATLFGNFCMILGDIEKISLRMPGVTPKKDDSYFCMSYKLPPGDLFIVKYEPDAHKETAHHMLLFGCQAPGSYHKAWNCGDMGSGTCSGSESILFGWARDAPALQLPKDVGFKIGGNTEIQYLALQIHYAHALEEKHYDRSGLTLHVTPAPQPNLASIYLLMAINAFIPPHSQGIHVDIACKYESDQEINAFAFRTHAHDLGRVITAYRIRNNTWRLLGKGDPQAPQAFYPMDNVTMIKKGDILAARCTYDTVNSGKTSATLIGSTAADEMCNFYMMYYRDANSSISTPEVCAEQHEYENLYDSFPIGSDVALRSGPGHHHHHHHHGSPEKEAGNESADVATDSKVTGTSQVFATSVPERTTVQTSTSEGKSTEKPLTRTSSSDQKSGGQINNVHEDGSDQIGTNGDVSNGDDDDDVSDGSDVQDGDGNVKEGDGNVEADGVIKVDAGIKDGDDIKDNDDDDVKDDDDDVKDDNDVKDDDDVTGNVKDDDDIKDDDDVRDSGNVKDNANNAKELNHVIQSLDVTNDRPITHTTSYQQAREITTGNPLQETTQSPQTKTSRSTTSDVSTSTSISEQITTVSELPSGSKFSRTTRSTKKSTSTSFDDDNLSKTTSSIGGERSQVEPSLAYGVTGFNVSLVESWPFEVTAGLGQVTGLAVDTAGRLFVFHRSERTWEADTFNIDDSFRNPQIRGPILGSTILVLDGVSGKVLEKHGENMFYMPHGLTIDHQDNVWVTDVGRHQVMKFPRGEFKKPTLVLGKNLAPGSGYEHFCKPTDVAVEKSGVFYVSDGYCNSRILKFSPEGRVMKIWGKASRHSVPLPGTFAIPHSLTLDENKGMLYVADRENGRIQCFDTEGKFHKQISSPKFGGLVFAVVFSNQDDVLYAVNSGFKTKVQGFTINPRSGDIIATWSPHGKGFSQPHAVVSNGSSIFVAEIGPNRVWKFEHPSKVSVKDENFVRGLNAAVQGSNPTKPSDETTTGKHDDTRKPHKSSNSPGYIILAILSVPVVVLLVVGLISRLTRGSHRSPKYDMMDASLGNHTGSGNWCNSMNCCNRQYRNMEELYLMDSDSDIDIYPDVRVGKK